MMKINKVISLLVDIWKKPIVRIATSLIILAIVFVNLPIKELWNTLRQMSFRIWGFTVAAFVLGHVVGVLKWSLLINFKNKILPFTVALRCYFAGLFANLCLPSLVGGDIVRAGLAISFSNKKGSVILGGLLDRFIDTSALGIIIIVGALFSPALLTAEDRKILFVIFLLLGCLFLFTIALLFLPLPKGMPERIKGLVERVRELVRHLIKNPRRAVVGLGLALLIQSVFVMLNVILGTAVGIHLPITVWFLVWPLAKLSAMVPISMGGLGVREVALAVLLGRFGVSFTSSVGVGLLWESVLISGGALGGIFYLLSSRNIPRSNEFVSSKPASQ